MCGACSDWGVGRHLFYIRHSGGGTRRTWTALWYTWCNLGVRVEYIVLSKTWCTLYITLVPSTVCFLNVLGVSVQFFGILEVHAQHFYSFGVLRVHVQFFGVRVIWSICRVLHMYFGILDVPIQYLHVYSLHSNMYCYNVDALGSME